MGWTQTSWMARKVGVREEVEGRWDSLGHCSRLTGRGRRGGGEREDRNKWSQTKRVGEGEEV